VTLEQDFETTRQCVRGTAGEAAIFRIEAAFVGDYVRELQQERNALQAVRLQMVHELLAALGREGAYPQSPAEVWGGIVAEVQRLRGERDALKAALEEGRCPECGTWVRESWWARDALGEVEKAT
jgi:hypothetical protein